MARETDSLAVEIVPTVSVESAAACCMLLNLFAAHEDGYELYLEDGEVHIREVRE